MRHLTYANVASTLALVFAMSGGALAANHYLIHSTKQISPKVLKKLHGARGRTGPGGAIGPQGVKGDTGGKGARGPEGTPGFSALSVLPAGKSENGEFAVSSPTPAAGAILTDAITFTVPLSAGLGEAQVDAHPVGIPDANCLGPGAAAKGFLCLYTSTLENLELEGAFNPETSPLAGGTGRFGTLLKWKATGEGLGPAEVTGTWTLTAG